MCLCVCSFVRPYMKENLMKILVCPTGALYVTTIASATLLNSGSALKAKINFDLLFLECCSHCHQNFNFVKDGGPQLTI